MSISSPTAARILRNGSSARSRSPRRDVVAAARFGVRVEWPDLHPGDALLAQVQRQLVGTVEEGVEVFVWSLGLLRRFRKSPVADLLLWARAHVAVPGAGVVDADALAAWPAEELVDRLPGRPCRTGPTGRCRWRSCRVPRPRWRRIPRRESAPARACRCAAGSAPGGRRGRSRGCTPRPPAAPKNVSPSPVRPSSVCTRTQRRLGNSPSRRVSISVIFTRILLFRVEAIGKFNRRGSLRSR